MNKDGGAEGPQGPGTPLTMSRTSACLMNHHPSLILGMTMGFLKERREDVEFHELKYRCNSENNKRSTWKIKL